jgi:hypothetical protein
VDASCLQVAGSAAVPVQQILGQPLRVVNLSAGLGDVKAYVSAMEICCLVSFSNVDFGILQADSLSLRKVDALVVHS